MQAAPLQKKTDRKCTVSGRSDSAKTAGTDHLSDRGGEAGTPLFLQRFMAAEDQPILPHFSTTGIAIQCFPAAGGAATTSASPESIPESAETPVPGLIVDDTAPDLLPGQIRKTEFLAELRSAVTQTAESALSNTGQSAADCPWIEYWFRYYENRDGVSIERAIVRFTSGLAAGLTSAREYIPIVCARGQEGISRWAATGEITGVPQELLTDVPGSGDMLSTMMNVGEELAQGALGLIQGIGGLFRKSRGNGGVSSADPAAVRSRLGAGRPLDSGVASRMSSVFGHDFSNVKVHIDADDAGLSRDLNARAFTVGSDIAFDTGEYRPGTLIGDALIAHELAHVVQQGGGNLNGAPMQKGGMESGALEEEADNSAVGAVTSMWGGLKEGFAGSKWNFLPQIRSGLKLQRCTTARNNELMSLAGLQRTFVEQRYRERELERRRQERLAEIERLRNTGVTNPEEQVAEVRPEDIIVTPENVRQQLDQTVRANTPPPGPTARWDNITDKPTYLAEANRVIGTISTVAKSSPDTQDIADLLKRIPIGINESSIIYALKRNYYAWYTGTNVMVGMSFIDDARRDPRNVFPIVAHEIGGHPVDRNFLEEISQEMLRGLDPTIRRSLVGQDYFMTYEYQSTEIYSAVRQRRYEHGVGGGFVPQHGAINADPNIRAQLHLMQTNWHPQVVKFVLIDLLQQLARNPQIRTIDIQYLQSQIQAIIGYRLEIPARAAGSLP